MQQDNTQQSINPNITALADALKNVVSQGISIEEAVLNFSEEGYEASDLSGALSELGYSPNAVVNLFQNVEMMAQQKQQPQVNQPNQVVQTEPENQDVQPEMQYGGNTTARGPLESKSIPRPLYMPAIPDQPNLIGAAYMLSDAFGELAGKGDKNKDGLRDGAFQDLKAKQARYKKKQLGNRTYEVDFKGNDPSNYVPTWEDLDKGTLRTKEQYQSDLMDKSQLTFNPETNKYESRMAASQLDLDAYGKDQQLEGAMGLRKFTEQIANLSDDEKQIIREGRNYEPGRLMGQGQSYIADNLSPKELKEAQDIYKNIMLGNVSGMPSMPTIKVGNQEFSNNLNQVKEKSIVSIPNSERPIVSAKPPFEEWAKKNQRDLLLKGITTSAGQMEAYNQAEFKYGGDLPKAQFNLPDNLFGLPTNQELVNPGSFSDMITNATGNVDYNTSTQLVKDSQLQQRQPKLGSTPDQQKMQEAFATKTVLDPGVNSNDSTVSKNPTVTRKRSLGNAYDQVETFIKDNPAMQAFGDVSQAAVMGANFANEWFKQAEADDYKNKLRNTTVADNVYLATENPVNKRGTWDVNTGLAESDNLVDYYAQAMYGKETYKKGGEFEPHMMYDPVSGKAYKANVEADHKRFAKMGFVHKDKMQQGGEIEVDQETLAALIAAGADIEML